MPTEPNVIGCSTEFIGDEFCEECWGGFYGSPECDRIRKDEEEDFVLICDKPEDEPVHVFIVVHNGIIDSVDLLDNSVLADERATEFLKENGYSSIEEYKEAEEDGHLDTEFKVFSKDVIMELK